ncbi:MAG: alkyl hydroperoxide reductase subunit F, partial [Bdellovibrionales bacterium]|nr:alkyl hydroperoxide reductase subunit F [Bdellovibrionales bacterium]
MLDSDTIEQLRSVFSRLESSVILKVASSSHADQTELLEMARDLTTTSPQIVAESLEVVSPSPRLELHRTSGFSGIAFRGVPGGHEFSSLVLSILYLDGKGKQPDAALQSRIRALRGPIRLKTFMSLTCENCPEVIQALNLMASLHSDFHHEVVDGAVAQDEVSELGIQGVPAVIADGKLIHSGKIQLIDLLAKLESHYGSEPRNTEPQHLGLFNVVVIGGGPAGASAAIYSARKGLKTVLIAERLGGQLQETKGIENMISMPYTEGVQLAAQLSEHMSRYPIQILEHRRVLRISGNGTKTLQLESGETLEAESIIIATGAKWRELGIPGEKEHIGTGVAFCAHCDGPFYKDRRVVVVGGGNSGVEAAIDLSGLASEVTLLEYNESLKADTVLVEKLKQIPNARIITQAKSSRVIGDGKKVTGIEYVDRSTGKTQALEVDGVFVQI